jgi:hypothetical protein
MVRSSGTIACDAAEPQMRPMPYHRCKAPSSVMAEARLPGHGTHSPLRMLRLIRRVRATGDEASRAIGSPSHSLSPITPCSCSSFRFLR